VRKTPTLFQRSSSDRRLVTPSVTPGCEWVLEGEGVATAKWDGTAVLIDERGGAWKRRDVKADQTAPPGFVAATDPDPVTGRVFGWVPMDPTDPGDQWLREAYALAPYEPGSYELIGPKVQGNPHGVDRHQLMKHGGVALPDAPGNFEALRAYLSDLPYEGIVFHHEDGRAAKIKRRDFGLPWPVKETVRG